MIASEPTQAVSLQSVLLPVLASLDRLLGQIGRARENEVQLGRVQILLESLPLSTEEYGLACLRLNNAWRYLRSHERGAARWELNMLRHALRNSLERTAAEPRLRRRSPLVR
jgi:hypothetical protein